MRKGLALLAIVFVDFDCFPRAFLPLVTWYPSATSTRLFGRQRDYSSRLQSRNRQKSRRKHYKYTNQQRRQRYRPSPECQRALDALLKGTSSLDNKASVSNLTTRDQVHLIQELERADRFSLIAKLAGRPNQRQQVLEAAIVALCRSRKYRSKALSLVSNTPYNISTSTCVALFESLPSSSDAVALMERLVSLDNANTKSIFVWNAALAKCRQDDNWQASLHFLRECKRHNVAPNEFTYEHVLYTCAQSGQTQVALTLLRELHQQQQQQNDAPVLSSPHVWGAALYACTKQQYGGYENALEILQCMNAHSVEINAIHVSALIKTCAHAGKVQVAMNVFQHCVEQQPLVLSLPNSNDIVTIPPVEVDVIMVNSVLLACSKAGNFTATAQVLQELKQGSFGEDVEPDVISYNTVLSACHDVDQAKALVKEMRMSRRHRYGAVPPDSITYTHAISACKGNVDAIHFFLDLARNDGIEPNVYMFSAAIWACGQDADAALELLEEMQSTACAPNVVSYNGVISSLASQGRAEEALSLFEELKDEEIKPNRVTFQKLAAAIRASQEDIAKSEMLQHILSLMNRNGMRANIGGPILEALIRQYGAGGKYAEARDVFDQIQGPVDANCLRAMLYACSAGEPPRWEDALSLLHTSDIVEGTRGPAKVDSKALSYAMLACAKADQWEEALNLAELYGRANKSSSDEDSGTLPAFNALMAACGRCGRPGVVLRLLNDMEPVFGVRPNEQSYRTAIIACNHAEHDKRRRERLGLPAKNSQEESFLQWWECSLSLLRRMKESKLPVDPQTYSSVISACEAAGQWQRALGVLHSMMKSKGQGTDDYSRLNLFCFNAAISACEKGGAWVEALELYYRMMDKGGTVKPNFVTLSSILVALQNAGQKELAQSTYEEGVKDGIVSPWKITRAKDGGKIRAMDLHSFSAAMANASVRSVIESLLSPEPAHDINGELVIIVGKGKGSEDKPVLLPAVRTLLKQDYGIAGEVDATNAGRFVIAPATLQSFVASRQWHA